MQKKKLLFQNRNKIHVMLGLFGYHIRATPVRSIKYDLGMEWNSRLAQASWYQRERWHHLSYVTHVTTLRVRHSQWRHKVGHAENIIIPADFIIVIDW